MQKAHAVKNYSFMYESQSALLLYTTIFGSIGALWYACDQEKTPCPGQHNMNWSEVTLSYNKGQDKTIKVERIAIGSDWGESLYEDEDILFKGRFELSYMEWFTTLDNPRNKKGYVWGLLPVNQIIYKGWGQTLQPYLEIGAGPMFFDNEIVENENKSTKFQFGDLLGFGLLHDRFEASLRYIHYSNANIATPNPAFDSFNVNIGLRF